MSTSIKAKCNSVIREDCTLISRNAPHLGGLLNIGAKPLPHHGLNALHQFDISRENPESI